MAYEGINLYQCFSKLFPWTHSQVIVVSGTFPNPCGHAILNAGGVGGHYFHIAGDGNDRPYYMDEAGYRRYLKENRKTELQRKSIKISKPDAMQRKFDELASKDWLWGVLPHNCATFVEELVKAGGSATGLYTNCPALEEWK